MKSNYEANINAFMLASIIMILMNHVYILFNCFNNKKNAACIFKMCIFYKIRS